VVAAGQNILQSCIAKDKDNLPLPTMTMANVEANEDASQVVPSEGPAPGPLGLIPLTSSFIFSFMCLYMS